MKDRFSVAMMKVQEGGMAAVWLAPVVIGLRPRSGRGGEESEFVFVFYMEVTALLDVVGKNLGSICVRCSTSAEIYHSFCGRELKHRVMNGAEWCKLEGLSSIMRNVHLVRSNLAVHPFSRGLSRSQRWFYVN